LHVLVDAFIELRKRNGMEECQLRIAGWLGDKNREYVEMQFDKLRKAGLESAFEYVGEVSRAAKIEFLSEIDVLSVPSIYRDPKGLYILEALAAGVPVIQPDHGAFPELIEKTKGGRLVPSEDPQALAHQLNLLLSDENARETLGRAGRQAVHEHFHAVRMAEETLRVYENLTQATQAV